jgi:hypothetical protein
LTDVTSKVAPFGIVEPFAAESTDGETALDQLFGIVESSNPFDYRLSDIRPIQIAAFNERLDTRRKQIAIVDQLASDLGIDHVEKLQGIVPLLFAHMTYKSYPESFVSKGQWENLLRWLDTVSTHRVTDVDVEGVVDIDDFLARLHAAGHYTMATSGTSGKCSLLPQSGHDMARSWDANARAFSWAWDINPDQSRTVLVFNAGNGPRRGVFISKGIAEAFGRPGARYWLTDDPVLVAEANRAGDLRKSMASGKATPSDIQALQESTRQRSSKMDFDVKQLFQRFLQHRDEPMILWGQPVAFYMFMQYAREQGIEDNAFHPDSAAMLGGGIKVDRLPDSWGEEVNRFQGDIRGARSCYGMSEMLIMMAECSHGKWHAPATSIVMVLDELGEQVMNPPEGIAEGRMGIFDLAQDGRWGGIITSDRVEVNFSKCSCGLSSPSVLACSRYTGAAGADDKLSCAGTMDLYIRGVIET